MFFMPNIYSNVPLGTRSQDPAASDVPDGSVEYFDFDWGAPIETEIVYGRTSYFCDTSGETSCGCGTPVEPVEEEPMCDCEDTQPVEEEPETCSCSSSSCEQNTETPQETIDDVCATNTPQQVDDCGYDIVMDT